MKKLLLLSLSSLFLFACQPEPPQEDPPVIEQRDRVIVYQLMTRLFGNTNTTNKKYGTLKENGVGKFGDISDKALAELWDLGATHIWYTGVLEHATMSMVAGEKQDDPDVIKGRAGSPYAIKDYYDVNPFLANDPARRMAEFEALIERTHQQNLKALIDFVPNHVARNYASDAKPDGINDLGASDDVSKGFAPNNNFYYLPGEAFKVPAGHDPLGPTEVAPGEDGLFEENPAKATGNDGFTATPNVGDWFETVKLNYGVDIQSDRTPHFDPIPETWTKMRDILLFWIGKGVDGFRCDMAEMVPVEFWKWAITSIKKEHPDVVFIAEIYNPAEYHNYIQTGGFDYLYDKVGLYDAVRRLMTGTGNSNEIAQALEQSKGIEDKMLRFLENHDEQRIASEPFAGTAMAGIPGMTLSALLSGGPVLLYFGQEVGEPGKGEEGFQGEDGRSTIFDFWGVPNHQAWMNGGAFDGGKLNDDQRKLRGFYQKLMRLSATESALTTGKFIPLPIPSAGDTSSINTFAFMRTTDTDQFLIVVNFDHNNSMETQINIPAVVWNQMGIPPGVNHRWKDLLGLYQATPINNEFGLSIALPPNSAFVLKRSETE